MLTNAHSSLYEDTNKWKDTNKIKEIEDTNKCSWIQRVNIVKISIALKPATN